MKGKLKYLTAAAEPKQTLYWKV